MSLKIRQTVIGIGIAIVSFVLAYTYIHWSPREYAIHSSLQSARVISNGQESFVELFISEQGNSNFAWKKKANALHNFLGLGGPLDYYYASHTLAWHCQNGKATPIEMPAHAGLRGLVMINGKLTWKGDEGSAWQWDGERFKKVDLPPAAVSGSAATDEDEEEEDEAEIQALHKQKDEIKKAGWQTANLRLSKAGMQQLTVGGVQLEDERAQVDGGASVLNMPRISTSDTLRIYDSSHTLLVTETVDGKQQLIDHQSYESRRAASPFAGVRRAMKTDVGMAFNVSRFLIWPLLVLSLPFAAKSALAKNEQRNFTYMPAQRSQFPQLDVVTFDAYSRDLEAAGFEVLFEGSATPATGTIIPGITRVLVHKRTYVFAEVFQVFPPMRPPLPVRCGITKYFDQEWSLGVSNGRALKAVLFTRLPRAVAFSFPGMTPANLLQKHQALCQQIAFDLGLRELTDMSMAAYMQIQQAKNERRLKERNKRFLAKYLRYRLGGELGPEWRGDWPKEAKKHSATHGFAAGG